MGSSPIMQGNCSWHNQEETKMIRDKIKQTLIFSFILLAITTINHTAYGETAAYTELNIQLPKDYSLTDFNSDYNIKVNGEDYVIKGSPFLYRDLTYIPVRDVSEIFNIYVTFNEADRTVLLASKEKEIIISPLMCIYGDRGTAGAVIKTEDHTAIEPGVAYMLVNDRSYVPIRFITENFGFSVDYDDANKQISIKGTAQTPGTAGSFYTEEQHVIIDVVSDYESKPSMQLKGTTDFLGEDKEVQADVKKEITKDVITETITVKESNGKQYKAVRKSRFNGSNSVGISEVLSDGRLENINLMPFAGRHPYSELTNLKLTGMNKYCNMNIQKINDTDAIVTYKITELNGEKVNISVFINKSNNKMLRYEETTEFSKKLFDIN